jgi:AcrR family transcriptional regulator
MNRSDASKRRVLDAAAAEFAAFGIAGARVDRIAAAANVNKAQMYAYFGGKEELFDAVLRDQIAAIVDAVPLTPDDLPGYAVRLYDRYLSHPELLRLATWYRLERVPTGDLLASFRDHADGKLRAIAAGQRAGHIDPAFTPADVYALVTAIAMTWSPVNVTDAAGRDDPESEHARRRSIIATVVARALARTNRGNGPGTPSKAAQAGHPKGERNTR